ncbi:MAG: HAD family hydrolase [Neisseriaceae bacterium]|nr:HAD family hydrolase [Neisseriaceae bacterium]
MNLAIFDLDNTLLLGDCDMAWARFLVEQGLYGPEHYQKRLAYYQDYQQGRLNMPEYLAYQLATLAAFSPETLTDLHEAYMTSEILPMICPTALSLVALHQRAQDEVMVITATNTFLAWPIVQHFGIDHLIGVDAEQNAQGYYTGRYVGEPSFSMGKVKRLKAWLAQRGQSLKDFDEVYFYSDSHNDLPLLQQVNHPIVVNPDERLNKVAQQQGWPILSFGHRLAPKGAHQGV